MNPEETARAELVRKLRAHAQIEDEGHRIDLMQAANEIESLAKLVPKTEDEAFREAWQNVIEELDALSGMMRDPFKAPEQSLEMLSGVLKAIWLLQVEWTVLHRAS